MNLYLLQFVQLQIKTLHLYLMKECICKYRRTYSIHQKLVILLMGNAFYGKGNDMVSKILLQAKSPEPLFLCGSSCYKAIVFLIYQRS